MEAQRLSRFIRILKSPTTPTQQRVAALERLKDSKQPEVLAAIATSCQAAPSAILEKSREIISNLSYEDFSMLVHFLLSDASGGHMGRVVFEVLYELKSRDVLRYIIEFASNTSETDARRKTMTKWMKDLNITEDCLQIMLNLPSWKDSTPSVLALALGKALRRMDDSVIASTVKLIRKANADVSLKGLGILEEIAKGRDISQLLMGILRETDDERVKSKVTKTIVKLSGNLRMVREALKDSDSRVRANALEFLWGIKEHKQQRVAKLLAEPHLSDFDNRTRANAGRVFYALGDPRGLETLLEMLDSPDELMRASAVWMLGEVREASLMGKLQELAQTDASQIVAENAKKALEKMGVWKLTVTDLLASLRDFTLRDPKTGLPQDKNYLTMLESFQARPSQELSDMMQVIQTTSPDLYMRMLAQVENSANEEAALAMLLAAAYCKDSRVRSHATLLIGQICGDEAVFRHFLADTDVRVKANAIEALEQHSAPFVTPMLVDSLRSANNRVLANAAKALCKRADLRGWRTLLINLRHSEPAFRASCVWALGEVGKPNITERLEFLKHDADENVRKHVRIALDKITARARKTPDAIRAKIRYVHVNRYPRVTCYVYVHSQEYPLTGLYAENFKIKENDISLPFKLSTQENSTQGLSIVILMDYSLSMSEGNLESMEEAVDGLIDSIGRRDRVAIIKFSRRVSIDLALTTDRTAINAAVHAPHTDNQGSMVLYDAISAAIQLLRDTAGLKSIVVLTDGEDSGSQVSSEQIIGAASGHNIAIYTIGLGENLDSESLTQIADSTSGRFFAASDSDVLHDIYREIFHALNSSYVLTYQSQASRVKGVSLLAVEVTHAKAFARDMVPLPSPS